MMRTKTTAWLALAIAALSCDSDTATPASGDPVGASAATAATGRYAPVERPLVEERDDGRIEWLVGADGALRMRVARSDGEKVPPEKIAARLQVAGRDVPLRAHDGELTGAVGPLEAELTDLTYAITVAGGAKWEGVLQLPPGGTDALVADPTIVVEPGTVGPNGGVVEVVGDQRIELLVDEESGEVRVYLLDESLEPVAVADDTEITVGWVE